MIHVLIPNKNKSSLENVINNFILLDKHFNFKSINIVDLGSHNFFDFSQKKYSKSINFVYWNTLYFNKSIAINLGLNYLKEYANDEIIICDADIILDKETLLLLINAESCILKAVKESNNSVRREAFGIIKTKISYLLNIDGYDSQFIGWGFEDHDVIKRLSHKIILEKLGVGLHLSHDDIERTQNYHTDSIEDMRFNNLKYFNSKSSLFGTLSKDTRNKKITHSILNNNNIIIHE